MVMFADMPSDDGQADFLLHAARDWREHRDPCPPLLIWHLVGDDEGAVVMMLDGVPDWNLRDNINELLVRVREEFGPAEWFAVVLDGYAYEGDGPAPSDLEEAFSLGDPEIVEHMVLILRRGGETAVFREIYRWTGPDGWEWDAPNVLYGFEDEITEAVRVQPLAV